jgi:hypothetical protein
MNLAGYLALKASMKPSVRTVLLTSIAAEPVEIKLGHPEAGSVIPGLAANPVLVEFLFNETEDGKPAISEFTLDSVIGLFKRMGPYAISAIVAASMRDEDNRQSLAGDAEIEGWIREWSPADQIKALLAIHEVTNLVDFFGLLWSLARILPVGQAMQSAMQSVVNSTSSEGDQQAAPETSQNVTAQNSDPAPLAIRNPTPATTKQLRSSLAASASTLPFDSVRPAAGSDAAA